MKGTLLLCEKCGEKFQKPSLWAKVFGGEITDMILVDPAPSLLSIFKKDRCPKCRSTKLRKI